MQKKRGPQNPDINAGRDLVLRISIFIPGEAPVEIPIVVHGFIGNMSGRKKTPQGVKEDLIAALKSVYGGMIK